MIFLLDSEAGFLDCHSDIEGHCAPTGKYVMRQIRFPEPNEW